MDWWLGEFVEDEDKDGSDRWHVPRYQYALAPNLYEEAIAAWQYTDVNDWCGEFEGREADAAKAA